jgi:hypothetical protein
MGAATISARQGRCGIRTIRTRRSCWYRPALFVCRSLTAKFVGFFDPGKAIDLRRISLSVMH